MGAAAALGPRQAAVLAHLEAHPGLTAWELARVFGLSGSLYELLRRLEQMARVVAVGEWEPAQGKRVCRWHVAPPGTVPPPLPPADPETVRRKRERDRRATRARRARARGLQVMPGVEPPSLRTPVRQPSAVDLPGAACRTADPALFFPPEGDDGAAAKAICAGCPVRAQCYAGAVQNGESWGIWGGVNFETAAAGVALWLAPE